MISKTINILTIIIFLCSCGQRTGTSNRPLDTNGKSSTPDPNQIKYINTVIDVGQKVFKNNCVGCHCGPGSHCEPPYTGELRPIFDSLPIDSLSHFIAFVKNSSRTKKGLRTNPFSTDDYKNLNYTHEFEKSLPDSLIRTVIEYVWLGYKWNKIK